MIDPKIVDALVDARGRAERSPLTDLTAREREVLAEIAQGKSNTAIAESLVLTKRAVEKHINSIFLKLDLADADDVSKRVKATLLFLSETSGRGRGTARGRLGDAPPHASRVALVAVAGVAARLRRDLRRVGEPAGAQHRQLDADEHASCSRPRDPRPIARVPRRRAVLERRRHGADPRGAAAARSEPLAGPAAAALRPLAERVVERAPRAPRAQQAWEDANRRAHNAAAGPRRRQRRSSPRPAEWSCSTSSAARGAAERVGLGGAPAPRCRRTRGQMTVAALGPAR